MKIEITTDSIIQAYKAKNYPLHEGHLNINIGGIRFNDNNDLFDDIKFIIWKEQGIWLLKQWNQTTKPGKYYLQNPENPKGCAILKEGYYKSAWKIGYHNGMHRALIQILPVTVHRDTNKDGVFDYNGSLDTGLFGINHHGTWNNNGNPYNTVYNWSAGCQVINGVNNQDEFMYLCDESSKIYGSNFSYALFNENDIKTIQPPIINTGTQSPDLI